MLSEIGFWLSLSIVFYVYLGYLICVRLLALVVNSGVRKANFEPTVSVVISAFNEALDIEQTVTNKLTQEYPPERLDVVVVSDGSTDATDAIVQSIATNSSGRVKLLRQEPRQGKTAAVNLAMTHASGDIVVFADANSIYAPNAVRALVRNFADASVGYVTGRMIYTNPTDSGIGEGSGKYMSYENLLRELETKLGSIVGVDGGIDAIRRTLYVPMRPDQLPDFVQPLSIIEQRKRVVYEPDAIVHEQALSNATDEFRMRVRVSLRALWALYDKRELLNPLRYGLFAWQLFSHKLLRYLAFIPLLSLIVFNFLIVGQHLFYACFLALQLSLYAFAGVGHLLRHSAAKTSKLLTPYYFVILNAACLVASWRFFNGQKMVLWKPRSGA